MRLEIVIFDTSVRIGSFSHGCSLSPERSDGDKYTRAMMALFGNVFRTPFFLAKCVKLALLFVLCERSNSFTHGMRESKLLCACATFAHAMCKRANLRTQNKHEKSSFEHSVKKYLFSIQVRKSDFILVGTFAPEQSEGEKATRG